MKKDLQTHLNLIKNHIKKNHKRWFKRYSGLRGVHVGKKTKNGNVKSYYSIVFHVDKKVESPGKKIPKFLYLTNGSNRTSIATDVIESGKLKFRSGIKLGDSVKNTNSTEKGTISLFLETSRGLYLGSNMHVLIPDYLDRGRIYYDLRREKNNVQTITYSNLDIASTAQLFIARFNGIDFGFGRVDNPERVENIIKGRGPVKGLISLNYSNYKSFNLMFRGVTSNERNCNIIDLGGVKETRFRNIYLTNLLLLNKCTQGGDSGAPLFDKNNKIAGIIVGDDKDFSYAMHIDDIIKFFQSSKL